MRRATQVVLGRYLVAPPPIENVMLDMRLALKHMRTKTT